MVDYLREYNELIFKQLVENDENINISIHFEKQDKSKVIKDLTYNISNNSIDIEKIGESRQDSDIASFSINDAKYIRKEIQINNEDMYFIYTYILTYDLDKKVLERKINTIESILKSSGMVSKKGYFRQEPIFKSCLPFMDNDKDIKNVAKRNILTSSIGVTYPFTLSTINDKHGIMYGTNLNNDSLIFIDRFNQDKYKNSNMCVFGTSGSGKSYFNKVMILRNHLLNISQYVIDPDREYGNLVNELNGSLIKIGPSSNTYINIFDIREDSLENDQSGYLQTKLSKLMAFFKLIFSDLNEDEKGYLESRIIKTYEDKSITFDDNSLYRKSNFKTTTDMPIFEDLYNNLDYKYQVKLLPFVKGSLKFFNNYTNIELDNNFIVGDVYELGEDNLKYGMFVFTDLFWDKIKSNRNENKIIYMDEVWKLIGITSNKEVASFIYKIFKTIRKYGGSAVAITQDISDMFSLQDGAFGKSLLNNSEFKAFFNMEEENIKILSENINLNEKEKIKIKSLNKGESLLFIGPNHVVSKIDSSDYEKNIINN